MSSYQVVFEDDFAYASGQELLATGRWAPGTAHWDSNLRCNDYGPSSYAYRAADVRTITDSAGRQLVALDYTYHNPPLDSVVSSNGEVTKGRFYKTSGLLRAVYRGDSSCADTGFRYGIFEVRCKVPDTDGLQAAFWLWNAHGCGATDVDRRPGDIWEIDAFETFRNGNERVFFSTIQPNAFTDHKSVSTLLDFPRGQSPATAFHTYTLEWTPTRLVYYVDGRITMIRRATRRNPNGTGAPDTELNLLLSAHYQWDCKKNYHCDTLADRTTPNDQRCPQPNDPYLIDYVRVYRPKSTAPNGSWPKLRRQPAHRRE
ncbi:glycoside hydrolase family 16 protein [Hymenobacter koreensis]|uniref:GH16 domain-containing protein n=1 Tax=Hymenobacter koreensis TaxID=1084523 RepID=A0ABP8IWG1_9BACT